jgi:ATP-dependent DNA helicase RecQ
LRSPLFLEFMQKRASSENLSLRFIEKLSALVTQQLSTLEKQYKFGSIIVIPSRTWAMRNDIAAMIAKNLNVPALTEILFWQELPQKRQGELLNNDQRRHNVEKKMATKFGIVIPKGAILLLDDYIGSGSTIKEAASALRKIAGTSRDIVPFTIASVKWKLGQPGMI